jgi:protease-4
LNNQSTLGMAQSKALRDELLSFKKSGKFVWLANSYTQKEYYNSVASPIYINPVGDMDFKGLSAELMFLKIYRKNRSKMEVIRHGKYKSV